MIKKHEFQTCLRMPLTLKKDIDTICTKYHTNPLDLMRKSIVKFVANIQQNPEETSRYMFVWYVRNHTSLIVWDGSTYTAHIQRTYHRDGSCFRPESGSFYVWSERFRKRCLGIPSSGSKSAVQRDFHLTDGSFIRGYPMEVPDIPWYVSFILNHISIRNPYDNWPSHSD